MAQLGAVSGVLGDYFYFRQSRWRWMETAAYPSPREFPLTGNISGNFRPIARYWNFDLTQKSRERLCFEINRAKTFTQEQGIISDVSGNDFIPGRVAVHTPRSTSVVGRSRGLIAYQYLFLNFIKKSVLGSTYVR